MDIFNIFAWVLFGLIVGAVANLIDPRPAEGGIVGAVLLGIGGALVGGFFGTLLFGVGVTGFNIESLIIAVLGSLLLLLIVRAMRSV